MQKIETEALDPKKELKGIYERLGPLLDKVGINPLTNCQGPLEVSGPYNFIGMPGVIDRIVMGTRTNKPGYIQIEHSTIREKSKYAAEHLLTENGTGWVEIKGPYDSRKFNRDTVFTDPAAPTGLLSGRTNSLLVLDRWFVLSNMLSKSIEDPENDIHKLKKQLKQFYGNFRNYLSGLGIVPDFTTTVYEGRSRAEIIKDSVGFALPGFADYFKSQEPAIVDKPKVYNNVKLPNTEGSWDIWFDEDIKPEDRVCLIFEGIQRFVDAHGLGIILNHIVDGKNIAEYQIWQNGDVRVATQDSVGSLNKANPLRSAYNPHLVKVEFDQLKRVVS